MPKEKIHFFAEDIDFKPKNKKEIREWISKVAISENKIIDSINIIFCSEAHLLTINQDYLEHDYHTDIITFDYAEDPDTIEGELYISIDMVKGNAAERNVTFEQELHRVIIHGVLHMIGFDDKTDESKIEMSQKEDQYLLLMGI